mgnify:CR=1 FL=1
MKIFRNIVLGIVCYFLIMWVGTLIKCEVLTYQHYDEFKDAYKQNTMLGDMEYFKVLRYAPSRSDIAQVYYVCKDNALGSVMTFHYSYEADLWEEICCSTIWSGVGGSASEVIWPYWWHFIYGGI